MRGLSRDTRGATAEYAVLVAVALAGLSLSALGDAFVDATVGDAKSRAVPSTASPTASVGAQAATVRALATLATDGLRAARETVGLRVEGLGRRIRGITAVDEPFEAIALSDAHLERARAAGIEIRGGRTRFDGNRVRVAELDLALDGHAYRHEGIVASDTAGTVVFDPEQRAVLVLKRRRLMSGTNGWEFPAGHVDEGEHPAIAAVRETVEETGFEPLDVIKLGEASASGNSTTRRFHLYGARAFREAGPAVDAFEASEMRWMPLDEMRSALLNGEFQEAASVLAGLLADAMGLFD
ncbi:MAG: NUDIX hydrolase [Polyangiales bacterium]|nr:NUDIX hydrolase [Myxococcales bacterium]